MHEKMPYSDTSLVCCETFVILLSASLKCYEWTEALRNTWYVM